ncbi:hypothetical protein OIV83_004951 [Microbotryomycetes sp. JL201]|nr:hypothetical protein OIV83_004951 [Microbotryomycetes sp. JL201]
MSSHTATGVEPLLDDDSPAEGRHQHNNRDIDDNTDELDTEPLEQGTRDRLYSVLNVERDCSPEDIVKAYKRLAGTFIAMLASTFR